MDAQETKYFIAIVCIVVLVCAIIITFTFIFFKYKSSIFTLQQKIGISHIATLEYERERIAADLHDEIGPTLAAIKMRIESMESNQNKIQSTIKPLSPLVNETISKLSAISKNLVPTSLKSLGLLQTINQLIEIFESNQTANISFITNYSKCVGIEIELQQSASGGDYTRNIRDRRRRCGVLTKHVTYELFPRLKYSRRARGKLLRYFTVHE